MGRSKISLLQNYYFGLLRSGNIGTKSCTKTTMKLLMVMTLTFEGWVGHDIGSLLLYSLTTLHHLLHLQYITYYMRRH